MKDRQNRISIQEACERIGVEQSFLIHCVRAHWLSPAFPETSELDDEDIARLELIRELRDDFGANEEALPIILHLLDQIYFLRYQVSELNVRLGRVDYSQKAS